MRSVLAAAAVCALVFCLGDQQGQFFQSAPSLSPRLRGPYSSAIPQPATPVYASAYQPVQNSGASGVAALSPLVAPAVVAMFAVVGYTLTSAATRAASSERTSPVELEPVQATNQADLSQAMGKVQDMIAEMTSSPAVLQATLEKSAGVQELARTRPEVAAALKDPAMMAKEMQVLTTMHKMIRGMREALADPVKKQQIAGQLQSAVETVAPRRRTPAPVMQLSQLSSTSKKVIGIDQDGLFEPREVSQAKPPVRLLERVQELRLLSTIADAGLLSKAQEAGVFSKLEQAGAFGLIEKTLPVIDELGVLGLLESALNVPANIQVLAAVALLGGETALIFAIPDDNVALIALQALTGLVAGGGAVTLLASAYFFSLLQGES